MRWWGRSEQLDLSWNEEQPPETVAVLFVASQPDSLLFIFPDQRPIFASSLMESAVILLRFDLTKCIFDLEHIHMTYESGVFLENIEMALVAMY